MLILQIIIIIVAKLTIRKQKKTADVLSAVFVYCC